MATQLWRLVGVVIATMIGTAQSASAQSLQRFSFTEPHLGTIVQLTLYAPDETVANEAARAGFARIKQLDQIFSDYKSDSEMMRLCEKSGSGEEVRVSEELYFLVQRSIEISEQTDGAFDISAGPLIQLWRRARKQKVLPTPEEIAAARERVGWKLIRLNREQMTIELTQPGMRLDFGGIAKGYIAQEVSRELREHGVTHSLVAVAGDIVAGDPPPDSKGWKVGVAPLDRPNGPPSRLLSLSNFAISTSGDAFQFVEIAGVRYSHIVDPRTGMALTERCSTTVLASDGTTADALATAVCVLGPEKGLKLIAENNKAESVEALIVRATDEGFQVTTSAGFAHHELK